MTVFGTRPEAIKMAPVVKALKNAEGIQCIVCVTAQHREMLDQVLELFDIKPDYDLNIMKPNQTLSMITANVITGMEEVLIKEKPDLVLVHGDTSTTFATALACYYQQIPVGHVEAGLRTYDKYSPFPEEMNRVLTGHIADYHFAPTNRNRENLIREGVDEKKIYITGNTVIDALLETANKKYEFEDETLRSIDFEKKRVIAVTCHRRENLGEYMAEIFSAIADIAREYEDVEVVYPVHMNPKVREEANQYLGGIKNIHLIEPLTYQPFVKLQAKSFFIITDSGGIQEEAPSLGKPVLVVRKETERPEAVEAGTVKMAGVERARVYALAKELLDNPKEYEKMAKAVNPYGDGLASGRISKIIQES